MHRSRLFLLLCALHCGIATTAQSSSSEALVQEVAPEQVAAMIAANKVVVFDCNEEETYVEAHVPGAILIVYDAVTAEKLPADHGTTLVFYCYSPECPAGAMAASSAIDLGFTDVRCMTAGIIGWQDAGFATEP